MRDPTRAGRNRRRTSHPERTPSALARGRRAGRRSLARQADCELAAVAERARRRIDAHRGKTRGRSVDGTSQGVAIATRASEGRADRTVGSERRVVGRGGFEPPKAEPPDLQSGPFGRSGISPVRSSDRRCDPSGGTRRNGTHRTRRVRRKTLGCSGPNAGWRTRDRDRASGDTARTRGNVSSCGRTGALSIGHGVRSARHRSLSHPREVSLRGNRSARKRASLRSSVVPGRIERLPHASTATRRSRPLEPAAGLEPATP